MFAVWCCIIAVLVAVCVPVLIATAAVRRDNIDKMVEMIERHHRHLASDDPAVVEEATRRWNEMIRHLKSQRLTREYGFILERLGSP